MVICEGGRSELQRAFSSLRSRFLVSLIQRLGTTDCGALVLRVPGSRKAMVWWSDQSHGSIEMSLTVESLEIIQSRWHLLSV